MRGGAGNDGAKEKKNLNSDPVFEQLGFKHNLKYGPRSKLRRACSRFLRFSYLLDFVALDALANIYIETVKDTINKLRHLAGIDVDYELRSSKAPYGEQVKKTGLNNKDLPFFYVNAIFQEQEIPQAYLKKELIDKFEPPPVGSSADEDFEPTSHLEIYDPTLEQEDQEHEDNEENAEDNAELQGKVVRIRVININELWLKVSPQRTAFSSLINECFQEGLECLKHFERWSRHDDLKDYVKVLESWDDKVCDEWDSPDDNNLNCDEWLQENPLFINQSQMVNELLSISFEKVVCFFKQLEPYLHQFWENKQLGNFAIIEDERLVNPTDVIPLLLQRFNDQKTNFENMIPEQRDLGMIRVNFKDVRSRLKPQAEQCFNMLKKMLPLIVRRRVEKAKMWLVQQIESLNKTPTNVETYVMQIQALEYIEKNYQGVKDKIDLNVQIFNICCQFEIESKEDKNKRFVDQAYTIMNNLNQAIMSTNDNASSRKEGMKTRINNKIPKLKEAVDTFNNVIYQDKYINIDSNIYGILNEIEQLEAKCEQIVSKSKKIQEFQRTLDMDLTSFDYVEEARIAMMYRGKLWKALNEWGDLTEHWQTSPFDQIEVSEISNKADSFTKTALQCERNLPRGCSAVAQLKQLVFDFKETMPIVEALGNKNLKGEHWEEIKTVLNIPEFPLEEKQFTLGKLIEFNVAAHQEEIINISTTATQEFNLKNQIDDIRATWNGIEFEAVRHRDKDAYKLTGLDKIQAVLDESLNNISNVIGSRYVKRLQTEAESLQTMLNNISDTLEQWKECQRNWLYLDNIFTSNEIRTKRSKDYNEFEGVNRQWNKTMKNVFTKKQKVQTQCTPVRCNEFVKMNVQMEKIQKSLEAYLEDQRKKFPRFYFLSNDELLQILAAGNDVRAVERHINKCFDNIVSLMLNEQPGTTDITGMISGEGEQVDFQKGIKVKSLGVEAWMSQIEEFMRTTVSRRISNAHKNFYSENTERKEWVLNHIGQAIATVSLLTWTEGCELAINDMDDNPFALQDYLGVNRQQLSQLTELIRGSLTPIKRKILVALITTDVHARDIVENLTNENVESTNDFNWQQQLRYYLEEDNVIVKQVNATIQYGYEYMGASSRLVITPLTDRCWITITGAININLGAAPAGPAGTGKTESTKDLAKALGIYCVVFNCSEQIEYKMMARLFSGLAQSGAWSCLDEFNRIDVEVLSVIAQQLLDIKEAKQQKKDRFVFSGVEMPLKIGCGVFITMNPGYAGRTELPDNLKVLFRPVSMMIPNYGLIAEIMLFAEGFENAKILSTKMVQLYKLASEQLSQQDHYDFGMRAVKSVLVMAGTLKRANPQLSEDVVLIRAMRDSNVPKFLADDLPLFQALIQDLFPGIQIPEVNYGELLEQIQESIDAKGMQRVPEFISKVIQLFDTFNVRFGVMVVGPTGAGKTTCYRVLAHAMGALRTIKKSVDQRYQEVKYKVLNPKSISMGELYGEENADTKEWTDGLASKIIRKFANDSTDRRNWCVFDGPVDALWIENMNTVLDDNMTLCLANGERIKLKHQMRMLFEVQDLAVASPATVSRCGMVYMTPSDLGWKPFFVSWLNSYIRSNEFLHDEAIELLEELFYTFVDEGFTKIAPIKDEEPMPTVPVQTVKCICNFLEYFIKNKSSIPINEKKEIWVRKLNYVFGFSFIWAFGASFKQTAARHLDNMLREFFGKCHIPMAETVFEYFFNDKEMKFQHWSKMVPAFEYDAKLPFFSLLVPTVDTVRYTTILDMLVQINKPVFFTGSTGVGKSLIMSQYIQKNKDKQGLAPIDLNFSAQTNSQTTQQSIESKLEKKKGKKFIGAKGSQQCVIFIDDVNMPTVEKYGAQPPIELLRQLIDSGGFYDRPHFFWKSIDKFIVLCAAAPPGGGRSPLTPRFMRHFHVMNVPDPTEDSMRSIFESILKEFLVNNHFSEGVRKCGNVAVTATVDLYTQITIGLLPIPAKFHYTFNLRDVSKVFQGMLMTKAVSVPNADVFTRLWINECSRVFNDRLINHEDRSFFQEIVMELLKTKFKVNWQQQEIFEGKNQIIFSNLLRLDAEEKLYEQIIDQNKLLKVLEEKLTDYNITMTNKMDLVFFEDAINHLSRITRILMQPRGNAMLIGVSGCGKQSLTRLASFMLEYGCFQIKLSKNYKPSHFREDLREQMLDSGCNAVPRTFLMTDSQIQDETFLEYINNFLNTGEITNLYAKEDYDTMLDSLSKVLQQQKRPENKEYAYITFIERLRDNFHIILCMSPVGDQLRIRCRKFPSLVNCCTLDWIDNWPEDALLNVSTKFISTLADTDDQVKQNLAEMFMKVHKSVEDISEKFYQELRRRVYITPKSYLDGINLFLSQLNEKRMEVQGNIDRLSNGIYKLKSTNDQIAGLKVTLTELQPKLDLENKNAKVQAEKIQESRVIAIAKESETEQESAVLQIESQKIDQLTKEAQVELAKAHPILEAAERAAAELSKDDVGEMKKLLNPPPIVETVMKSVLIYFGSPKQDWATALKVMSDMKFLTNLINYNKEDVSQQILNKVKPIVTKPEFQPEQVQSKSKAAAGLAKWCVSVREYAEALKIVKPKQKKVQEMEAKQREAMVLVQGKQQELHVIKTNLQQLQQEYDKTLAYIKQLDDDKNNCEKRLTNAGKLINLLGDEGERWFVTVDELKKEVVKLHGNVFIAAASVSYIGPFTGSYRESLVEQWKQLCFDNEIQVSDKYSLVYTLGSPVEIRNWGICGLPSDSVSVDNGILSTKTQRWPLMIDPQTQANNWIKKMHRESGLRVIKLSHGEGSSYQKEMESAILTGQTVLIEDVSQELDPGLDPILTKATYKDEGVEKIFFGDRPLIYDRNFKLYITTKLPNPHFLPEICIKLTIVNFTVTFDGLEEQMLADVVIKEAPEVEIKRDKLVMEIAGNKNELKRLENKILKDLADSNQDTILDNQELIDTLEISKTKSKSIETSLVEAEVVEKTINETRNSYREVSKRGSILYFVISDLAFIDPMYQNSLSYVKKLFNDAIVQTPKCEELSDRIIALKDSITKTLYTNICRGLFEEHKLIYSFLICSSIKRNEKQINEICWSYLVRGAGLFNKNEQPTRPEEAHHFITQVAWDIAFCLDVYVPDVFGGLCKQITDNLKEWEHYAINEEEHYLTQIPCDYGSKLNMFEKLLILKVFKPEKIMFGCAKYVETDLGKLYAESPTATMDSLFSASDKITPIIFVLSSGADPTQQVIQFAHKMDYYDRLQYKSLGQGQELVAQQMIENGKREGNWVLLQNCHLFQSWMPQLEAISESFKEDEDSVHEDFRLILTSMPATYFPVAILQNGLKMTTEPPRGIRANLKRSYNNLITEETYEQCASAKKEEFDGQDAWKRLLFGLCFFHASVQERRKFGPLGWNIRYEFNDSDLDTSITMLRNFLTDAEEIPWDAMKYMTGQINYGGRVTDDWDRVLLLNVLQKFYTDELFTEDYKFSSSGIYYVPAHSSLTQIRDYIQSLPTDEEPEVFGMHQNANIAYQQQESERIIRIILNVQPRVNTGVGGKSSDEIIYELAEELEANMPALIDREEHAKDIFKPNNKGLLHCLSTVLLQEIERYNKLLSKMTTSLSLIMKAIQGLVIMSDELDKMYSSLLKNQIPPNWAEVSYPSLKPLSSWIKDLNLRVEFMRSWLKHGHPSSYWLSGFFFPHGFMTGTLQTFARKHNKAIDLLEFKFRVKDFVEASEVEHAPDDGIYVFGLFIEGAKWAFEAQCLEEQQPGEMTSQMPMIHFLPTEVVNVEVGNQQSQIEELDAENYKCPVYKTSVRAGVLSTTGQSTNFILAVDLPCSEIEAPEHWTLRGTALLSMLND